MAPRCFDSSSSSLKEPVVVVETLLLPSGSRVNNSCSNMPGIAYHLRTLLASCSPDRKRIRRRWCRRPRQDNVVEKERMASTVLPNQDDVEEQTSEDLSSSSEESELYHPNRRWISHESDDDEKSPEHKHRRRIRVIDSYDFDVTPQLPLLVHKNTTDKKVDSVAVASIPQDLWRDVCSYINDPTTLCRLSCVSKELHDTVESASTPTVWQRFYEERWIRPSSSSVSTDKSTICLEMSESSSSHHWKKMFQRRFALERGRVIRPVRRLSQNTM